MADRIWSVYLSGEIHSDWRERIEAGARAAGGWVGPGRPHPVLCLYISRKISRSKSMINTAPHLHLPFVEKLESALAGSFVISEAPESRTVSYAT